MAVTIKPFVVGSKKATTALLGAGAGFGAFVVCIKFLGLGFRESMIAAGLVMGASGGQYGFMEGIRDIIGKGKPV